MKLCDKCFRVGEYKPGPCVVAVGVEEYDLCSSCESEVRDLINSDKPVAKPAPKKRKGRQKAAKQ